jgi:hypothetical protein
VACGGGSGEHVAARTAVRLPNGRIGGSVAGWQPGRAAHHPCCLAPRWPCPPCPGPRSAGSGRVGGAARSRSRAAGRSRSTTSASGVSQWLFTQPVLRCSTEPSAEPSRNRLVIRAGAPHRGQGWGRASGSLSRVGRPAIPDRAAAPSFPRWLPSPPQRSVVPQWASSVAGRMDEVPCVTIWPWTASWPSPETARQRAVASRQDRGPSCSTGRRFGLDNNRKLQKASLALPALLACPAVAIRPTLARAQAVTILDVSRIYDRVATPAVG